MEHEIILPPQNVATTPPHLQGLNQAQKKAVETVDGPVLVLAGAGTGKTRVLISRLTHILYEAKAWPHQILAVTFTNKAANEMRNRIDAMMGNPVKGLWIGTFHSIAARILRQYAEFVGLPPEFTIIDTDDQIRLMRQILKVEKLDDKKENAKKILGHIETWKDRGLTPGKVAVEQCYSEEAKQAYDIYPLYEARLKALNAVDFGNLILHNLTLFTEQPEILKKFHHQFQYLMVDEYQDTNIAQYLWLRLLSQAHKNICCVGDDDQSIYGWRGAEVGNILRFEKDYPGAKVVRLEQNYRSTEHILEAASQLISNNKERLGKTLWTDQKGGDKIRLKNTWDAPEEARWVGEEIEALQREGVSLKDTAILVRSGFQTREFEECFITLGVPYRIFGGFRFYERQEIRDAIAYLRLIVVPHDGLAFERIINTPKRGVGGATLQLIHTYSREKQISLIDATEALLTTNEIKGKAKSNLTLFLKDLRRWQSEFKATPPETLAKQVLDESGYTAMWKGDKSPDAPGRLENLKELVAAIAEFVDLPSFLEHVSLVMETTQKTTDDAVTVMTMHSAKGLEFDYVFLTGWEDGIFPSQNAILFDRSIEEERRLAYVGITRAKKRAHISFANNRQYFGQWSSNPPSRFIDELPKHTIEELPGVFQRMPQRGHFAAQPALSKPDLPQGKYRRGERVFHMKFGYGRIQNIEGDRLTIIFDHSGPKKVLENFIEKTE